MQELIFMLVIILTAECYADCAEVCEYLVHNLLNLCAGESSVCGGELKADCDGVDFLCVVGVNNLCTFEDALALFFPASLKALKENACGNLNADIVCH